MKRIALVTGMDTNAIAAAICVGLLESGYEVIATAESKYRSGEEERLGFDAAHADLPPVTFEDADFYSGEGLADLIERLSTRTYDVVVNCGTTLAVTSGGGLRSEFLDFDYAEFNRVLQDNVTTV